MYATGMVAQVTMEMDHYGIEILLISECRWTGIGKVQPVSCRMICRRFYSGHTKVTVIQVLHQQIMLTTR